MGIGGEEGGALVEMALTMPLLFLILTAAASYSFALYNLQELESAVSGAAQALGVESSVVSNPCAVVVSQVTASLPQWSASNLTYTVTFSNGTGSAYSPYSWTGSTSPSGCDAMSGSSTPQGVGEPITVRVQYSFIGALPILNWLPAWVIGPLGNLQASETAVAN
jgi:Flp pilus assembly protein TadG